MSKKGQARDTKETANLREYLREHHPAVFNAVRDAALNETRTFNQMVTHILRQWVVTPVAEKDLPPFLHPYAVPPYRVTCGCTNDHDTAASKVEHFLDGMVSPDEGGNE